MNTKTWLATALLFIIATTLFVLKKDGWSIVAIIAAIGSQILIFSVWQDAKFGTIPNLIILATAILSLGMTNWGYPDGNFTYGKFVLKDIQYNPSDFGKP